MGQLEAVVMWLLVRGEPRQVGGAEGVREQQWEPQEWAQESLQQEMV